MKKLSLILFILSLLMLSCGEKSTAQKDPSLKEVFKDYYLVGTALNMYQINKNDEKALELVKEQFNCVTPENMMKWERIHPKPDEYNFEPADSLIAFCERNDITVIGHTLVWHSQTPKWVFEDENGNPLDREALLRRVKDHIETVVGRYKGRIKGWDVVNEAFLDDGTLRDTKWRQIIGDDFILKAFEYAHNADPDLELYYNDFNMWHPGKIKSVQNLVNQMKELGIKIDGVGLQGHWGYDYPTMEELENAFAEYAKLDVNIMVTELDMRVLPAPEFSTDADVRKSYQTDPKYNPFVDGFPDSMHTKQSEAYASFFRLFNKYKDKVTRVTFWGVHDGYSWRNGWPIRGRTSYPLLFDRDCNPKPAFFEVIKTVEN